MEGMGMPEARSHALKVRRVQKRKKPTFKRQEGYRRAMLGESWRRPKGRHSKLRKGRKPRGSLPGVGYRSPRAVRGLGSLGYREVRVFSVRDLESLDPKQDMAVLAGTVGTKKRLSLIKMAEEKGIRISNA
jgi:large subunit ribosomal protein L32e